jgi:predicted nucleotidyltransferase
LNKGTAMPSIVARLAQKQLTNPPQWLPSNVHYEVMMGSEAYGVASDTSDIDVYGFCIPQKDMIFPHLRGEIPGFGNQINRFEQWQEHHIKDLDKGKEYDCSIYNIVKYFQLCMENNPNMLDSLFVPERCVLHITSIGQMVREKRKMFLSRHVKHKLLGYSFSQMHKMRLKTPKEGSKRAKDIEEFSFDRKYAYHVVRLVLQAEQILIEHDLDLEKNREVLKAIRRGEKSMDDIESWFSEKEKYLEKLYQESTLRHSPDEDAIKQLLLDCLEHHYGSLSDAIINPDKAVQALRDIQQIIQKNQNLL